MDNNRFYNPYMSNPYTQIRQEIVHVNGENGAKAYQMAPNSNALLLDDTNPIVWLVQTDGAGYKTVVPYTITPYKPEPPVDVKSLEQRISNIEEVLTTYVKSDNADTDEKQSRSGKTNASKR